MKLYSCLVFTVLLLLTYNVFAMQQQESEKIEKLTLNQSIELPHAQLVQIGYFPTKKQITFVTSTNYIHSSSIQPTNVMWLTLNQPYKQIQTIGFSYYNNKIIWAAIAKDNNKDKDILIGTISQSSNYSLLSFDRSHKMFQIKPFIKNKKELWCTILSYNKNTNLVSKKDHNCELQLDS